MSQRRSNNAFFLTDHNEERFRVCKPFFLSTLGISSRMIRTVSDEARLVVQKIVMEDFRGKHGHHSHVDDVIKEGVREFIGKIPKIESQYCRTDTKKEYIEGDKTIADIHREYVRVCTQNQEPYVNYVMFNMIFNTEFNIAFYQPKKDQCEDCVAFSNATEEGKEQLLVSYNTHLKEKEEEMDKNNTKNDHSIIVAVYDLQAVMPCPRGDVSNFFYVFKLNTLNFTIFEINTKDVNCFVWHEREANRGANEIGTCVLNYLEDLQRNATDGKKFDVIFYSDNCCGQQKNKFIISMYMYAVAVYDFINSITHKFLIKGHSQNEGDSLHSVIQRSICRTLKAGPIYTPDQYITIIRTAM